MNLSVIRKIVQIVAFFFLVYGGAESGYYLSDKLSGALPALSCAYDKQGADYCVLIPFQHQMHHRVGEAMARGGDIWMALLPSLITLITFLVLFVILNKGFCGWICPLGTFQELLHLLGQKLGLQQNESLEPATVKKIRPLKWIILVLLVFTFPVLSGLGYANHDLGDTFCRICPSRILTTLAVGDTTQLHVDTATTTTMVLSVLADLLFGIMIAFALTFRQPFCRICPLLALHAVFKKLGLLRLVKQAVPRCEKCGLCAKACPMDIKEIHTEMQQKNVTFDDCTLCGRCVEFCPDKGVLQLKYTVIPVFSADPAYFKRRKKAQTKWEKINIRHYLQSWQKKRSQH